MVRDPDGLIERRFPREEMKDLYFQSHEVFRHEFAEFAYPALQAVQSIVDDGSAGSTALDDLKSRLIEHRQGHPKRFKHQNTYSDGLPTFVIHG
jgi:hypothetical protein